MNFPIDVARGPTAPSGHQMQFLFTDHTLDTNRRELRRGDESITIEPQVLDLLIYLLENPDRVVSKSDLIASVWRAGLSRI